MAMAVILAAHDSLPGQNNNESWIFIGKLGGKSTSDVQCTCTKILPNDNPGFQSYLVNIKMYLHVVL